MNYIKELNAFYDRLEITELSSSAVNLWHALMHVNNKAGWSETFTVPIAVLSIKTGLSPKTIERARNELKQKTFIEFKSRKGNKSAIYRLISLSAIKEQQEVKPDPPPKEDPPKKEEEEKPKLNIYDSFILAFNKQPTVFQIEDINTYIDQDGLPEEVIHVAFEKAGKGGHNFNFAKTMLNTWAKMKIRTVEEAKAEIENHDAKQKIRGERRGRGAINQPSTSGAGEKKSEIRTANERRKRIAQKPRSPDTDITF